MNSDVKGWLELFIRWAHVFAGIMWVGATFYFTWLDGRFTELEEKAKKDPNAEKTVWMVHSGGFYLVEKQKRPTMMPLTLHWFKWESFTTWITGFFLFGLVYYQGGLMAEFEDWPIKSSTAIWISLGLLVAGWIVYDLLWNLVKNELVGAFISFLLIAFCAFVFLGGAELNIFGHHFAYHPWHALFPTRAAYMQLGAMMGTIMAANVWMRILPPQRRMVAALKAGKEPNLYEGARAKGRSKHNTFIVFPVVFIMISNHYPGTFGSHYNWALLCGLVLMGWIAAKIIRRA